MPKSPGLQSVCPIAQGKHLASRALLCAQSARDALLAMLELRDPQGPSCSQIVYAPDKRRLGLLRNILSSPAVTPSREALAYVPHEV